MGFIKLFWTMGDAGLLNSGLGKYYELFGINICLLAEKWITISEVIILPSSYAF